MPDLEWHKFLEIGVDFIDDDHKHLLGIMLKIKQAVQESNHSECSSLLDQLLKFAHEHFTREEDFLKSVKYPELENHKIYHQKLLEKAITIKRICAGIESDHDLNECFDNMANFLIDDILRGDIHFKSYLEYNGYLDKDNIK